MTVPQPERRPKGQSARARSGWARRCAGAALAATLLAWPATGWAADRQPKPMVALKLEALGVPALSLAALSNGDSILTLDFLDTSHLLVTFGTRGLVPRLAGDPPTHQDRMVGVEIVDLPSGKVEARTEWHMHDRGRYLWNLGQGRFLVRMGQELASMEPLAKMASGRPFERTMLRRPRFQPTMIVVSPDKGVLTVESAVQLQEKVVELGDVPPGEIPAKTLVEFYRVKDGASGEPAPIEPAGTLVAPQPVYLPVAADGSLWATETSHNQVGHQLRLFGGQSIPVGKLGSTCDPQLQMVSRSEFVAVTCSGSDDRTKMAVYSLDGHEAWEEPMGGMALPAFALAPGAGRFAMLRSVSSMSSVGTIGTADLATPTDKQELRVYETESGDMLLKAPCSPVMKTAENFGMSEDGSLAAVVRDGAIVVYKLDAPDKRALEDIAQVAKLAPPVSRAPVTLLRITGAMQAKIVAPDVPGAAASAASVAGAPAVASAVALETRTAALNGDVETQPGRQPPTLLKPGEKPEFGKRNPENPPVDAAPGPNERN